MDPNADCAMDDSKAVLAANAAFYHAFESFDLTRMEDVWLRAAHVKCVHRAGDCSSDGGQ